MIAELVVDARATLGEGSLWDVPSQVLYWIDVLEGRLFVYHPESGENRSFDLGQAVGTVVSRTNGEVIAALADGIYSYDLSRHLLKELVDLEKDNTGNRFNDGKCDPEGRFWVGSVSFNCDIPGAGSLYRIGGDLKPLKMLDNLTISNGICWSKKKARMYFIDSPTREVWSLAYEQATGNIADQSVCIRIPEGEGVPDGMSIDSDGNLWVAQFGGSRVGCYSPDSGRKLDEVILPVSNITSCAFGGKNLDTLYITSARIGLDDQALNNQPMAGGLFQAVPGVRGVASVPFAG